MSDGYSTVPPAEGGSGRRRRVSSRRAGAFSPLASGGSGIRKKQTSEPYAFMPTATPTAASNAYNAVPAMPAVGGPPQRLPSLAAHGAPPPASTFGAASPLAAHPPSQSVKSPHKRKNKKILKKKNYRFFERFSMAAPRTPQRRPSSARCPQPTRRARSARAAARCRAAR